MLPYPSGTLHMGHVLNYTMGDVLTHFRRRQGWMVMRPMGWDAFGLPAENAAIREGGHPKEIVERNIKEIRAQMRRIGWVIDWDREISAHHPGFYRWTQWLFLRFFERGLAYRKAAPVNWCPNDQTVVANEYVIDGHCERCGALVEARNLEQWFMKITAYADELLRFEGADWPERTMTIQRNWIGRSEGAEIIFRVEELDRDIEVFTTRPDTLYGATFFVVAPEHPFVEEFGNDEVKEYARRTAAKRGEERATEEEKTGVFTGHYAVNPVNGEQLPIWVADYVLMDYGTGAIMAVPAHDERDLQFAETFDLPVVTVIDEDGRLVNSQEFDGLPFEEAKKAIVEKLRAEGKGASAVSYRLRDWSMSRQRYWGCPIPIVHCPACGPVAVPDDQLPVLLPEVEDYRPKGVPPLASNKEWLHTECPRCGGPATREADTMDTFVDSSWYFLRYADPRNEESPFDRRVVDYWAPISHYIGGIDHATGHLLYSRFFVKVMNEMGMLGFREPFARLYHQGWVQMGGSKMSKSKGNVSGPDELVEAYGADAVRLNILFMGPADQDMEWTDAGIEGMSRFVRRLWRVVNEVAETGARGHEWSAGAPRPRDDPARQRRPRPPHAVPHADLGGDGAGQRPGRLARRARRALRRRDRGLAAPAVGTARDRGAVAAARARATLGAAVARGRPGPARPRDLPARRPGQREGPRPHGSPRRPPGGGAGRARQGLREGAGAPGRQGDPADDRRAGQARQSRRRLVTDRTF